MADHQSPTVACVARGFSSRPTSVCLAPIAPVREDPSNPPRGCPSRTQPCESLKLRPRDAARESPNKNSNHLASLESLRVSFYNIKNPAARCSLKRKEKVAKKESYHPRCLIKPTFRCKYGRNTTVSQHPCMDAHTLMLLSACSRREAWTSHQPRRGRQGKRKGNMTGNSCTGHVIVENRTTAAKRKRDKGTLLSLT